MKVHKRKIVACIIFIAFSIVLGCILWLPSVRHRELTPLQKKMEIIARNVGQLKSQVTVPTKRQSSIELVEAAQKAAEESRQLVPAKAVSIPESDRQKFIADYQAQIDVLIKDFATIDQALHDEKYDEAQKAFDDLKEIKREGHGKFNARN
jgi:soluble cytochrome b562